MMKRTQQKKNKTPRELAHVAGVAAPAIGTRASHPIAVTRFECTVRPTELVTSGLKKKQQKNGQ
eukprot:COSAG06_NODE_23536_length_688_cov_95.198642_2_plen_64_part_00